MLKSYFNILVKQMTIVL